MDCCCCLCRWGETMSLICDHQLHPQVICEYEEPRWNYIDRVKTKNSEKKPVPVPLCLTWTDPGTNPDLRGDRQATNRLSHSTAWHGVLHSCTYMPSMLGV
jgi:hypothetical protein